MLQEDIAAEKAQHAKRMRERIPDIRFETIVEEENASGVPYESVVNVVESVV